MIITDEATGVKYLVTEIKDEHPKGPKVALVVGHHEASKGDYSNLFKQHEWDYWKWFAENYEKWEGDVSIFFHDPKINSYIERQRDTAKRTADYDLVFELHWNAFDPDGDGVDNASGTECLVYPGNERSFKTAEYFCNTMSNSGFKNRGVKILNPGDNGYGFVSETKGDAILVEFFFADSKTDFEYWTTEAGVYAINRAIGRYTELFKG